MIKAAPGSERLKSFVERIEKLIEERIAIQGDIKDVFSHAKGVGYDVKTMRKVIALRAMDAGDRAEQEALLDTYMHALETVDRVEARVASGESIRKAADAEGMPKSTAIRQVTQNRRNVKNGSVKEDARQEETAGPITVVASREGVLGIAAETECTRSPSLSSPSHKLPEPAETRGENGLDATLTADDFPGAEAPPQFTDNTTERLALQEVGTGPARPEGTSLFQRITGAFVDPTKDDDLTIPKFLRRTA